MFTITGEDLRKKKKGKKRRHWTMLYGRCTVNCHLHFLYFGFEMNRWCHVKYEPILCITMMSQVNSWFQRHLTVVYFVTLLNKTVFAFGFYWKIFVVWWGQWRNTGKIGYAIIFYCSSLLSTNYQCWFYALKKSWMDKRQVVAKSKRTQYKALWDTAG